MGFDCGVKRDGGGKKSRGRSSVDGITNGCGISFNWRTNRVGRMVRGWMVGFGSSGVNIRTNSIGIGLDCVSDERSGCNWRTS